MTELTDRMRTCAARIAAITDPGRNDASINDAVDLLIEASNVIEAQQPVPPPIEPPPPDFAIDRTASPPWTVPPPPDVPSSRWERETRPGACPRCDSRAAKKVRRDGRRLMLVCPVCATAWEWKPTAEWK